MTTIHVFASISARFLLLAFSFFPLFLLGQGPDNLSPQAVNMAEVRALIGYPPMAREAEIQGTVVVRVKIDASGKYETDSLIVDPHPILSKAVQTHVPQLHFTPAVQKGKAVSVWVTIPFDFRMLEDDMPMLGRGWMLKKLEDIPKVDPDKITSLFLNHQKLDRLPAEIFELPKLQELRLNSNEFDHVPAGIRQLKKLKVLCLARNQITELPAWLFELEQLEYLDLSGNQLRSLPSGLAQMKQLRVLRLDGNQLQSFPEVLKQLPDLERLELRDNKFDEKTERKVNKAFRKILRKW